MISEKVCHKSIEAELRVEVAKMEGKLAATESTLKEKLALIKTLETQLSSTDEDLSIAVPKLESKLSKMESKLHTTEAQRQREHYY